MVDADVIYEKIKQIKACLTRIQDKTQGKRESLNDLDTEEIFILNLQRAIQSAIDLAAHIVADEGWGPVVELRENFSILEGKGIIDDELSADLIKMVGFRNIAIHEYSELDDEILKNILSHKLLSLEKFYTAIVKHFGL